MNSPINLLLVLWLVITSAMVLIRLLGRRRAAADGPERPTTGASPAILIAPPVIDGGITPGPPDPATGGGPNATAMMPDLASAPIRTLTDVLDGITLPYDLAPLTLVVEDPDRHAIFLTTHSNAAEVGDRFADELERLGFELESVDFDQAVATRGDDVISLKIVPDADQVDYADGRRYGAAGRGDVALEVWIGRSPVPPATPE